MAGGVHWKTEHTLGMAGEGNDSMAFPVFSVLALWGTALNGLEQSSDPPH